MASALTGVGAPIAALSTLVHSTQRLKRQQWLSAEQLAVHRRTRLQHLLVRAAAAPYYREVLLGSGIKDPRRIELQELERLPFLDRQIIAQRGLDAFLTVPKSGLVSATTSGSTGTPGQFLRSSLEEAEYPARKRRVYAAYGCSPFERQVSIAAPNQVERAGPVALLRKMGVMNGVERLPASLPPEQMLQRVRAVAPGLITGYAGAIEALAEHMLAIDVRIRPPHAVFCMAMEVTDHCLAVIERAFHAPAVDVYVTNEFGVIAWSCPVRRDVLHVNDDAFVVEVIGPDGNPAPPGIQGELVVTSLSLTAMPLIRYRMGDIAARVAEPCECGRGLGLLTRLHGRTAHAIRRADGGLIVTPLITNLFGRAKAYEWVRQFQVREEAGRRLRVLLETRRPPSETQRNTLAQLLESGVGPEFQIVFELVDRIPPAPNGKLQFLVPLSPAQPQATPIPPSPRPRAA